VGSLFSIEREREREREVKKIIIMMCLYDEYFFT